MTHTQTIKELKDQNAELLEALKEIQRVNAQYDNNLLAKELRSKIFNITSFSIKKAEG